jgi:hypothetical protein
MIRLSNGRCELLEGCLDAVAGGDVGGEFIVAAAQILDERLKIAVLRRLGIRPPGGSKVCPEHKEEPGP